MIFIHPRVVLALSIALTVAACTDARDDVQRCVKNGGPFRLGDSLVAYRSEGGFVDADAASRVPGVVAVTPFVLKEALIASSPTSPAAIVRGIDFTSPVGRALANNIESGSTPGATTTPPGAMIGYRFATREKLRAGDTLRLAAPSNGGQTNLIVLTVTGIVRVGSGDQDERTVFIRADDAMKAFALDTPTGIALETASLAAATAARDAVAAALGPDVRVRDWRDLNKHTLEALAKNLGVNDVDATTLDKNLSLVCAALR